MDTETLSDDERREQAWYDERTRCWHAFADAADASAFGNHNPAIALCAEHPELSAELRRFVTGLREGRIEKVGPYDYKPVRKKL